MPKRERNCKRVRIYLDPSDPVQDMLSRCLEALDDLSSKDRNAWFVCALANYQRELVDDDSPSSDMTLLRHRLIAQSLEGRGITMPVVVPPGSSYQEQGGPAYSAASAQPADASQPQSGSRLTPATKTPAKADLGLEGKNTETIDPQNSSNSQQQIKGPDDALPGPTSPSPSPLMQRLARVM